MSFLTLSGGTLNVKIIESPLGMVHAEIIWFRAVLVRLGLILAMRFEKR